MICLCQQYNQDSKDLHQSLKTIGNHCPVVVIHDDGFLPQDVHSPFHYYIAQPHDSGKPLYYNQLNVPDYWEIDGNQHEAKVKDFDAVRAIIHYAEPKHLRLIQTVEWLDTKGCVRSIDRYNQFGWRFAQTIFTPEQQTITTTYYTKQNREIIVENHQTGTVILNDTPLVRMFSSRIDFILHYLKQANFTLDRIIYNSLAEPFLVAYYLKETGSDILVWQEDIHNDIPGNMAMILQDDVPRSTQILIQSKQVYQRLNELIPQYHNNKYYFAGNVYPIKRQNGLTNTILIYTNSDQIEHITLLIESLPMYRFKIAALTEMSPSLMALQSYSNVQLFPNVTMNRVAILNETCDIYLDINHYDEILHAVRTAFEHNMLLLAFSNTIHHTQYVCDHLIFDTGQVNQMIEILKELSDNKEKLMTLLQKQYHTSDHKEQADYAKVWENMHV